LNETSWQYLLTIEIEQIPTKTMEISPSKTLKINSYFTTIQEQQLLDVLKIHRSTFAWDYKNMEGIHPYICTHHIYIKDDSLPIKQNQRIMNPTLKDIVKGDSQKFLDARFIYPISDSVWVSPLVVMT
jgi:hypothetical protein